MAQWWVIAVGERPTASGEPQKCYTTYWTTDLGPAMKAPYGFQRVAYLPADATPERQADWINLVAPDRAYLPPGP